MFFLQVLIMAIQPSPQVSPQASGRQQRRGRIGFNGELLESTLAGYLLGVGYRVYSTALMCFYRPDGISPFGPGGLNAYAYCLGDPVNALDPTGHSAWFTRFLSHRLNPSAMPKPRPLPPALPRAWPLSSVSGGAAGKNYAGVLIDKVLRTLRPTALTKLRSVSQAVKRRVDEFSERNFKMFAEGRRSQEWLPFRAEGRDVTYVEKVILAAKGEVPGVSHAQAHRTMKLSEARRLMAEQDEGSWYTGVGVRGRIEDFLSRTELAHRARVSIDREHIRRAG